MNGSEKFLDVPAYAVTGPDILKHSQQEVGCDVQGVVKVLGDTDPRQPWPGQFIGWKVTSIGCNAQKINSKIYKFGG